MTDKTKCPFPIVFASAATCLQAQRAVLRTPPAEFQTCRGFQLPVLPTSLWLLQASPAVQSPPEPQLLAQLPTGTLVTIFRYPDQGPEGCFCPSRAWKDTNCCQLLRGTILCKLMHFFLCHLSSFSQSCTERQRPEMNAHFATAQASSSFIPRFLSM